MKKMNAMESNVSKNTFVAVERFNAAFNSRDVNAVMDAMTEDCVFENTNPPPDGVRLEGADTEGVLGKILCP